MPSHAFDRMPLEHEFTHYVVTGNDRAAMRLVQNWLDGTCLQWPGEFRLHVEVGTHSPFEPDYRTPIEQPNVLIQTGGDAGTVRITWLSTDAIAEIHSTLPEATLWLSPAALSRFESSQRSFLLATLVFLLRRLGWYHVHGATLIDPRGRGWLIAGDSNCGKSTTTALLATRGWQVGTEDIGFIVQDGDHIVSRGMSAPIALRDGGRDLLGLPGGTPLLRTEPKTGFWPEELGTAWAPCVRPEIIAFPRIGERTRVERAPTLVALREVVKWSMWVLYEQAFAQEHLDVLGRLAGQSRCFNLTLGPDLFDNPDMLESMV